MSTTAVRPVTLVPRLDAKPWGGRRLAEVGIALPADETMGDALLTAPETTVASEPVRGTPLGELARHDPAAWTGRRGEIQQPSNVTCRLADRGQVDATGRVRDLHHAEGLALIDPHSRPEPIPPVCLGGSDTGRTLQVATPHFALERITRDDIRAVPLPAVESPQVLTCVAGGEMVDAAGRVSSHPLARRSSSRRAPPAFPKRRFVRWAWPWTLGGRAVFQVQRIRRESCYSRRILGAQFIVPQASGRRALEDGEGRWQSHRHGTLRS